MNKTRRRKQRARRRETGLAVWRTDDGWIYIGRPSLVTGWRFGESSYSSEPIQVGAAQGIDTTYDPKD